MAELVTVARPYAKAAFNFALEKGRLKEWAELLALTAAVASDPTMKLSIGSPRIKAEQLVGAFADVCGGKMDEQGRNFIAQLASNKRLALLPVISELYQQHLSAHENRKTVSVRTAFELSVAEKENLARAMQKRLGHQVEIEALVDKNLIGGVIIQAGDLVIDNSIKGKVNRLAKALNS